MKKEFEVKDYIKELNAMKSGSPLNSEDLKIAIDIINIIADKKEKLSEPIFVPTSDQLLCKSNEVGKQSNFRLVSNEQNP